MDKKELYNNEFIIKLTIDGTSFEDVEFKITDPNKTICEQIKKIVSIFHLPDADNQNCPISYMLGQILDEAEEPVILELEDEDGREKCLMDYNVQSGDYLHLISVPAYACPIPMEMEREWELYCLNKM